MDPNAALEELRKLIETVMNDWDSDTATQTEVEMANLFAALDEWLTKGGVLPNQWSRHK